MIRQGEISSVIRAVPICLMWAKLHDAAPGIKPLRDRWHMSRSLDEATGTNYLAISESALPLQTIFIQITGDDQLLQLSGLSCIGIQQQLMML